MATTSAKQSTENIEGHITKQKPPKKTGGVKASTPKKPIEKEKIDSVEKLQAKIQAIFKEANDGSSSQLLQYNQIALEMEEGYLKAHEAYSQHLNDIYKARADKENEVNEKYDYDLFKVKEVYDIKHSDSVNSKIFNAMLEDKKEELKGINDEFNEKMKNNKKEYNDRIDSLNKTAQENRDNINHIDYLEDIKVKINGFLEPHSEPKNKKEGTSGLVPKTEGKTIKAKK